MDSLTTSEMRELCNGFATAVEFVAAHENVDKPKFCLLIFQDDGLGQYVSNCVREDVVKGVEEFLERFKNKEDMPRGS